MNLTGQWKGKYTYGEGYPSQYIGKSEPFEFDIVDKDGTISGICIDNLVKSKKGNESYIIGVFKQNEIIFKKRYKFHFALDDSGYLILDDKIKFDGVDYKGRLHRTFFSRKQYFSGEWSIKSKVQDKNNFTHTFICRGTWKMSKTR